MNSKFDDKVVIVTGASSGIGAETAEYFAKRGASVVLCGRNIDNLNQICNTCVSFGDIPRPLVISCDVTEEDFAETIVQSTLDHFGKIDILINNVGILLFDTVESFDVQKFDELMNVNIRSVIRLTNAAIPYLIETKGNIVNVSSVAGLRAFPGYLSYCISKAAMDQFTACIALELAPKGVRVNSVNPGVIVTDIFRRSGLKEIEIQNYLEEAKLTHPLGRVGHVKEVSHTIGYLASIEANFITGVTLPVDGGKHALCPK